MQLWVLVTLVMSVDLIVRGTAREDERPVVHTEGGKIAGFMEKSTKGNEFYSFHSIPYAKPPVGSLRLKDPVDSEGWKGVRDGSVLPPCCSQIPFFNVVKRKPVYDGDEDCLYLSVFTSKPGEPDAQLPVMVFIHGGAFMAGGISLYSPYVLLNEDVVLVLIQYRLGVLGFLSTEDSVIPGNFGLKDQTSALRWVQRNIHHFGGDSDRVTIFGESAGGASVHFHILSPYSTGLFARAIMQSGTLFCPWAMGGAYKQVAQYTGKLFACSSSSSSSDDMLDLSSHDLLRCLQNVDVQNLTLSLMDHVLINFNPVLLGPRVDGDFLPSAPEILMIQGQHDAVDLMSGITSHEGGLFALPLFESEQLQLDLLNNFPVIGPASLDLAQGDHLSEELARKIFEHYVGGVRVDVQDSDNICKMYGDCHFNMAHDLTAIIYTENMSPDKKTFLYELDYRGERSFSDYFDTDTGHHWVSHVDDLFYLFTGAGTIWKTLEMEEDLKLRDIITQLWANFAATGTPTPDDSLGFIWEASSPTLQHLSLTPTPTMQPDKRKEVRAFWKSLPTKQNNLLLHTNKVTFLKNESSHKVEEENLEEVEIIEEQEYGVRNEL